MKKITKKDLVWEYKKASELLDTHAFCKVKSRSSFNAVVRQVGGRYQYVIEYLKPITDKIYANGEVSILYGDADVGHDAFTYVQNHLITLTNKYIQKMNDLEELVEKFNRINNEEAKNEKNNAYTGVNYYDYCKR